MSMIKLTDILNELSINNPAITPERVHDYFCKNSFTNENWKKYEKLRDSYCNKVNMHICSTYELVYTLSKSDLNNFYNEMQKLVWKQWIDHGRRLGWNKSASIYFTTRYGYEFNRRFCTYTLTQ